MLTSVLAHAGEPAAPHDVWSAWNADPFIIVTLGAAVWLYRRGSAGRSRPIDAWRARAFAVAIVVLAVALLSPLEAVAGALASAHMVQHVLLIVVAAPLLAFSAPASRLLRASPAAVRQAPRRVPRGLRARASAIASDPVTVWLLHVGTLWLWHSAAAYGATLTNGVAHAAEHVMFLGSALLLWRVLIGSRREIVPGGIALLLVFGTAMANVLLSLLLTFANEPWYAGYATTTQPWGLDPLTDQQLAGVLMWVPAGALYVAVGLALFVSWVRDSEPAVS